MSRHNSPTVRKQYHSIAAGFVQGLTRLYEARITSLSMTAAVCRLRIGSVDGPVGAPKHPVIDDLLSVSYQEFDSFRYVTDVSHLVYATTLLDTFLSDTTRFLLLLFPAAPWLTAGAMAVLLAAAGMALVRFDPLLSSRDLALEIARRAQPGDRIMIYGDQAFGSSLLFYLERPIELVNGRTTSMWFGSTLPDAPQIFLDDTALDAAWRGPARVFLFVPPQHRARVTSLLGEHAYVLAESSGKTIFSNRP